MTQHPFLNMHASCMKNFTLILADFDLWCSEASLVKLYDYFCFDVNTSFESSFSYFVGIGCSEEGSSTTKIWS